MERPVKDIKYLERLKTTIKEMNLPIDIGIIEP
jgi:hypothetical protein